MPRLDGTGPQGQGPLTGRGMGDCTGAIPVNCFRRGLGLRSRRGMGMGMGWSATDLTPGERKEALKKEKELLKQELEAIEEEIKESEK